MFSDLEIIKELERELGLSDPLPKRSLGEKIPRRPGGEDEISYEYITGNYCYGFFVDDKNNVIGLAITNSGLEKISSTLFKLKHLKALNLGANKITSIQAEIKLLSDLEILLSR